MLILSEMTYCSRRPAVTQWEQQETTYYVEGQQIPRQTFKFLRASVDAFVKDLGYICDLKMNVDKTLICLTSKCQLRSLQRFLVKQNEPRPSHRTTEPIRAWPVGNGFILAVC